MGIINYSAFGNSGIVRLYDKDNMLVAESGSFQDGLILEKAKMPYKMSAAAQSRSLECALIYEGRNVYNKLLKRPEMIDGVYSYTPKEDMWVKRNLIQIFYAADDEEIKVLKKGYYGTEVYDLLKRIKYNLKQV